MGEGDVMSAGMVISKPIPLGQRVPWLIVVAEPAINTLDFADDNTVATICYLVPAEELDAALYAFSDFSIPKPVDPMAMDERIILKRKVGHRHPAAPWLYSMRSYVQGETHRGRKFHPVYGWREVYNNYYVTVYFESRPYTVIQDERLPVFTVGAWDYPQEFRRYTFKYFDSSVQLLNVEKSAYKFADTEIRIPKDFQFPIAEGTLKLFWYRVHADYLLDEDGKASQLDKALQTTNKFTFMGYDPEQLRVAVYKTKPRFIGVDPVSVLGYADGEPPLLYDVEIDILYRKDGHNISADSTGNLKRVVKVSDGMPPFPASDYARMFLSPRDTLVDIV